MYTAMDYFQNPLNSFINAFSVSINCIWSFLNSIIVPLYDNVMHYLTLKWGFLVSLHKKICYKPSVSYIAGLISFLLWNYTIVKL